VGVMRAEIDPGESRRLHDQQVSPTVARTVLGARLKELRESAHITRQEAGEAIRASESKMSRLELGRTGFKRRDLTDLLTLYGLSDEAERATLLALAEQANVSGWWRDYEDVVPGWFEPYLGLEQAASIIRTYEVTFVPGLLQTEDYARAVLRAGRSDAPEAEVDRQAAVRMRRQQILHRQNPTRLWAVIDETALRRPVGGTSAMHAQIQHLLKVAQLPHVKLQVLPFSAGGDTGVGVPMTMLRFAEAGVADVVYLEHLISAVYPSRDADLVYYRNVLNRLAGRAQAPAATVVTLQHILDET
jgi:transcriptional regulator with XRE-family HTH domain